MNQLQTTLNRNPLIWVRDFWRLAKPYWNSEEKFKASLLLALCIIFNLLAIAGTVMINKWYNVFYDAIQNYNKVAFYHAIIKFCIIAFVYIACMISAFYCQKVLEIKWRRWLTKYYLEQWFSYKAYYKTKFLSAISDNPDQRISIDISSYISVSVTLILGLLISLVTLVSFSIMLWDLSGTISFAIAGHKITIYGYMLWAAVIYAIAGTYVMFKIGRPLIRLDYLKQVYEADFRYGLVRVREYSENIAFYNGEAPEKANLMRRFTHVVNNFMAIIFRQIKISIFGSGYAQLAIIFPIVVAAPRYFAKLIKLGAVMQILNAFGKVQDSLSYFINAYTTLSDWRATMDRLLGFQTAIKEASELKILAIQKHGMHTLKLKHVKLNLPDGEPLAQNISFCLESGDRLLVRGRSGCGKTTLLRTIAGLWSFAEGDISQAPNLNSLFISQKPYLPIDQLRNAICYPKIKDLPDNSTLVKIMQDCQIGHLMTKLNKVMDWNNTLSLGEQQRVAFCRILINKPDIVYLDEATSALDEENEAILYNLIIKHLPNTTIVSVAHRSSVSRWHTQELDFNQLPI